VVCAGTETDNERIVWKGLYCACSSRKRVALEHVPSRSNVSVSLCVLAMFIALVTVSFWVYTMDVYGVYVMHLDVYVAWTRSTFSA